MVVSSQCMEPTHSVFRPYYCRALLADTAYLRKKFYITQWRKLLYTHKWEHIRKLELSCS